MYFFKFYYAFLLPKCFIQYKFSFQIQHIVYQIQCLFLETSTVSGDLGKMIISQPVLCISPNSRQRQTHSSAVLHTELHKHGYWGWFVGKMKELVVIKWERLLVTIQVFLGTSHCWPVWEEIIPVQLLSSNKKPQSLEGRGNKINIFQHYKSIWSSDSTGFNLLMVLSSEYDHLTEICE